VQVGGQRRRRRRRRRRLWIAGVEVALDRLLAELLALPALLPAAAAASSPAPSTTSTGRRRRRSATTAAPRLLQLQSVNTAHRRLR